MSRIFSEDRRPRVPQKCEREARGAVDPEVRSDEQGTDIDDTPREPFSFSLPGCRLKLQFCVGNRAYGHAWLRGLEISHPDQFATIGGILRTVLVADGGDITQQGVAEHSQQVATFLIKKQLKVVPKDGCIMSNNGDGIRHAKYSQSKNIAVLWLRVGGTVYYTFDDHGGVTFHRGIYVLQNLKHGRTVAPIKERTPLRVIKELAQLRLTHGQRKAYEKRFQLNGTLVSFRKLREPHRKNRVTERKLRENGR